MMELEKDNYTETVEVVGNYNVIDTTTGLSEKGKVTIPDYFRYNYRLLLANDDYIKNNLYVMGPGYIQKVDYEYSAKLVSITTETIVKSTTTEYIND